MRIRSRIISSKQHTTGYVLSDGQRVTRDEAIDLADSGELRGVRVVNSNPRYLMSTADRSLYDLPTVAQADEPVRTSRTQNRRGSSSRSRTTNSRSGRRTAR